MFKRIRALVGSVGLVAGLGVPAAIGVAYLAPGVASANVTCTYDNSLASYNVGEYDYPYDTTYFPESSSSDVGGDNLTICLDHSDAVWSIYFNGAVSAYLGEQTTVDYQLVTVDYSSAISASQWYIACVSGTSSAQIRNVGSNKLIDSYVSGGNLPTFPPNDVWANNDSGVASHFNLYYSNGASYC